MKRLCCLSLLVVLSLSARAAKDSAWKDVRGNVFRAQAVEALGPLALFEFSGHDGRLIPFSALPPEQCVQFYQETKKTPPRAADWKHANSDASYELVRHGPKLVKDTTLVDADLAGPEPLFYLVVYVANAESKTWDLLGKTVPLYADLHQRYPQEFAALLYGIENSLNDQKNMATSMHVPWLVADAYSESILATFTRFAPLDAKGGVIVFSRTGVPVYGRDLTDEAKVIEPFQQLRTLLDTIRPDNPAGWKDRAYYLRAIQPVAFASGHSDPVLVGNPLRADGLRQRKVYLVDASIAVAADGHVTAVTLTPDEQNTPGKLAPALAAALQQSAVFVPAVQDGKFVDGTYHYRLEVPH